MSVDFVAYEDFNVFLNMKKGQEERLKNVKNHLLATVSKLGSFPSSTKHPPCVTALTLLTSSHKSSC